MKKKKIKGLILRVFLKAHASSNGGDSRGRGESARC